MASRVNRRLSRLVLAARAALGWERLWPALAPLVGVAVLFLASAWMGLWMGLAPAAKAVGLALFAGLLVAASWRLLRVRWPGREEAMRRLEADAGLAHRPLHAHEDTLPEGADAFAAALWREHRRRARERLAALRLPLPRADLVPHDPYALRAAVGLLGFVGVLAGAGALGERLATPFDFAGRASAAGAAASRLDAWVTPPAYTGRAPLFLSAATRVDTADGIRVPAGSVLTVRAQGVAGTRLLVAAAEGVHEEEMAAVRDASVDVTAYQADLPIERSLAVEVRRGGRTLEEWRFVADRDTPPVARLTAPPAASARHAFELRYELHDDYAIVAAEARLAPLSAPAERRALVEDPRFPLALPGGAGMSGAARTVHDLSTHPFAGRPVEVVLEAADGAGQIGRSEPAVFRIPQRTFTNPMAQAIVEQRTLLALDARNHARVIDAMDLLLLAPEDMGDAGAFLALKAAYGELVAAETDEELRSMLDRLWDLALMLEDDGMSEIERALQAAQERLRTAIEDGASPEEIARLAAELREAMQRYMQALAERAPDDRAGPVDPDAQMLSQSDLDEMVKRIEELARQGRTAEAEALLAELAQIMQNLQMAERGRGPQGQGDPMGEDGRTLDELGRMIQRQQQLMDETYGHSRGEGGAGPSGRSDEGAPEAGSPQAPGEALTGLRQRQEDLRHDLEALMRRLEEQGFEPGERLGEAEGQMGEAGAALGRGDPGSAVDDQGEALQALREGAQSMAQQMAEARGQGGGPGGEDAGLPRQGPGRDPLGRTRREGGYTDTSRVGIPDEIEAQRARRVLQELRERLDVMDLPRLEREYLERLLP